MECNKSGCDQSKYGETEMALSSTQRTPERQEMEYTGSGLETMPSEKNKWLKKIT